MSAFTDNGILARLPGEYVSPGVARLPDPSTAVRGDTRRTLVNAGPHGCVRITYKLLTHRVGTGTDHFWSAIHAERL